MSFDLSRGNLILINPEFSLPKEPLPEDLIPLTPSGCLLNRQAALMLLQLLHETGCCGSILPVSGYRSFSEQKQIWEESMLQNGEAFTRKFVALPGHSEHQSGLSIDLGEAKETIDFLCPSLPDTGIFANFRKAAPGYGFIERYPAGKETVTGIGAEPWHFRYVGYPHSIIMTREQMTLEEYILFLKESSSYKQPFIFTSPQFSIEITYLTVEKEIPLKMEDAASCPCQFSGTNEGGLISTLWRAKH